MPYLFTFVPVYPFFSSIDLPPRTNKPKGIKSYHFLFACDKEMKSI